MSGPPFGFGMPGDPNEGSGNSPGGPGGSGGFGGPAGGQGGPLGPLGDPQQFADALRQFADLMSWQGGPVNWDLAKNVARQTVAAKGDPSVLDIERSKITEAVRTADVWLEDATTLPAGIRTVQAWSRSEWVEATLPVWSKLCDPIAARAVDAMGGMLTEDPDELGGDLPPEMRTAMAAMTGGLGPLGGLGEMMRRIGGMMVGGQIGAAVGALAQEVVSSTDVGLPLGPPGTAALLPAGVSAFGNGLSINEDEVRLFLALREAAHHRLFAHVPWLRARLLGAVEDYARGIKVDAAALRDAMPQIDPANPEALNEALSGAALFQPEDTDEQKAALARLETMLALVEGWVATVVADAANDRLPQAVALAEAIRRRRATGGPAERTFATLVGLELRPRRLREAAAIWRGLTDARGVDGRDAIWNHPDLLPTADDFDDPDGFVRGRPELDISGLNDRQASASDIPATGSGAAQAAGSGQHRPPGSGDDPGPDPGDLRLPEARPPAEDSPALEDGPAPEDGPASEDGPAPEDGPDEH
jgi:putative hydrolase